VLLGHLRRRRLLPVAAALVAAADLARVPPANARAAPVQTTNSIVHVVAVLAAADPVAVRIVAVLMGRNHVHAVVPAAVLVDQQQRRSPAYPSTGTNNSSSPRLKNS
jgi:hypothetical protein